MESIFRQTFGAEKLLIRLSCSVAYQDAIRVIRVIRVIRGQKSIRAIRGQKTIH